jgi:hypothetical protein
MVALCALALSTATVALLLAYVDGHSVWWRLSVITGGLAISCGAIAALLGRPAPTPHHAEGAAHRDPIEDEVERASIPAEMVASDHVEAITATLSAEEADPMAPSHPWLPPDEPRWHQPGAAR